MKQTLKVEGMTCGHCEKAVEAAVLAVDPKAQVKADRQTGLVTIETQRSEANWVAAVEQEGYRASLT